MTLDAAGTGFVATVGDIGAAASVSPVDPTAGERTSPEKIDRLTSIRGFAALHVALYHCEEIVGGFNLRPWTGVVAKGYLAVDFFFLLSGFILAHVYAASFDAGRGRPARFIGLRVARIYPVHLLTFAVAVALLAPAYGFVEAHLLDDRPQTLFTNLLMVHAWGVDRGLSWNFASWSISAEWFAYLTFPLTLALTRFARRPSIALPAAAVSIALLGVFAQRAFPPGFTFAGWHFVSHAEAAADTFDLTFDYGLVRVTTEFVAGLFLWRAYDRLRSATCGWAGPAGIGAGVLLLAVMHLRWTSFAAWQDPLAVLLTGVFIFCLALDRVWMRRFFDHRLPVFLGEASYSIYMVHSLVVIAYAFALRSRLLPVTSTLAGGTAMAALWFAVILPAGIACYRWVEVPARNIVRGWLERAPK